MDGIILINKPKGCTSHDVVYKVKKLLNEKVGHAGTLDPMATGVLPLLIGKGTLCSKYLINHDKKYEVVLELGKKTTTADAEGEVIEEQNIDKSILDKNNVIQVLNTFVGKQKQTPPIYSAIKVNGKKLYEYARKGQNIEIEPRQIEIYEMNLQNVDIEKQQISFTVKCSKGTYIRSLCEDIAKAFNTVGFMKELNRLQVGEFKIEDAVFGDTFQKQENDAFGDTFQKQENVSFEKLNNEQIKKLEQSNSFISIEDLFKDKPKVELDNRKLQLFINGVKLTQELENGIYRIYNNNNFIGIGIVDNKLLKRDIII